MNRIVVYIMAIFSLIGALDCIIGNKIGLGKKFEEGINTMGSLALSIIGIYALAPLAADVISPVITPLFKLIGADPSIFTSSILACDMGGYAAALKLAQSKEMVLFSGIILASGMGATIGFSIPFGMGVIDKEDMPYFAKGILIGIITMPIGCFVGGMLIGIDSINILINLIPVIILSILLSIGLIKAPEKIMKGFGYLGKVIALLSVVGLSASIFEYLTGIALIPGLMPLKDSAWIVVSIAIILSGAYPMVYTITRVFEKPFKTVGRYLGVNEESIAGILACLASNIPMFLIMKDMDERGKVLNAAFAVGGAFVFGGQFGFVAGVEKSVITPFIISKLVCGITAILLAYSLTQKNEKLVEVEV